MPSTGAVALCSGPLPKPDEKASPAPGIGIKIADSCSRIRAKPELLVDGDSKELCFSLRLGAKAPRKEDLLFGLSERLAEALKRLLVEEDKRRCEVDEESRNALPFRLLSEDLPSCSCRSLGEEGA